MGLIEGFRPLASCIYISIVLKQDSPTIDYEFVARLFRIEICVADEFGVHARASYCHVRADEAHENYTRFRRSVRPPQAVNQL